MAGSFYQQCPLSEVYLMYTRFHVAVLTSSCDQLCQDRLF